MVTELYIENNRLDINADISALLNFALDDIKDFSSRSTTWSKTIVLPGTQNNNRLFGHIFQIGQANYYDGQIENVGYNFNASKSADCIIFQDQIQTFKGILRLLQINIYKGLIEYEVSVFGKLAGLNVALSGGLIEDLDFSAYDHTYNDANIVASWDNPGGSGYYYPLIDYGTYSTNKHDWDIGTFRPALYVAEYIDKMFAAAGFRYDAPLFETPRFMSLVNPHNAKVLTSNITRLYEATINVGKFPGYPEVSLPDVPFGSITGGALLNFDTQSGSGFTWNGPGTIFTYLGSVTANIQFEYSWPVTFDYTGFPYGVTMHVMKNGDGNANSIHTKEIYVFENIYGPGEIPLPQTVSGTFTASLAPGDTIEFRFFQRATTGNIFNFQVVSGYWKATSASGAGIPVPIQIGDPVAVNDAIPKNIRQIDYLVGIVKLFNLYVYEDKFDTSLIHIQPYIDFYSTDQTTSVDWTFKLDRDQAIKIKPMSELTSKVYNFKFKQDSDYFNEQYRKRYSQGYGDRSYDSEFEFTEQKSEFEVIFSSTPLVGYGGEEKVYSTIFKQSNNNEETVDSNIRILQTKKITGLTNPWSILDGATVLNTLTRYGYAGHFDDPDAPSTDINFGATRELFFVLATGNLSNNQFNIYWSGYMREITDKDSKLLSANFYLTPADIANLDFSKYVYLDGVLFRLNSIKNYNASKPATCQVELLKVNELNFTEATTPEGPPEGNFLLWSNENILYYDGPADDEEILWRGDAKNAEANYIFNKSSSSSNPVFGQFRVFKNAVEIATFSNDASGTLFFSDGDIVEVRVNGILGLTELLISSDVDGVIHSDVASTVSKTFSWTIMGDRIYQITANA